MGTVNGLKGMERVEGLFHYNKHALTEIIIQTVHLKLDSNEKLDFTVGLFSGI